MNRVAVALGDEGLRRDVARCAELAGHVARAVRPGADLAECADGADVIVVDANEPADMAVIARLRATRGGLRIVAVGHGAGRRAGLDSLTHGADEFVRMPFDVDTLERALDGERTRTPPGAAPDEFTTADPVVSRLLDGAARAAESEATIVVRGESGTGKSTLARFIHRRSRQRHGPLVTIACTDLSEADARRAFVRSDGSLGRGDGAAGGTLVLDEVGELAPGLQQLLLEALQAPRQSGSAGRDAPMRVVATSTRPLEEEVRQGRLREDLRLRLAVIELCIPPLRERPADVDLLARRMAETFAERQGTAPPELSGRALAALHGLPLRGNAWELSSLMQRAAMLFVGCEVDVEALLSRRAPEPTQAGLPPTLNLKQLEREAIVRSLARRGGNRTRASRDLGISVRTLRNKIRQYGLA